MSEREFHKDLEMFLMQLSIYSYEGRDPFAKGLCADALASIPQWIPVSEELPEAEKVVLVVVNGSVGMARLYSDGWYWDMDEWHKPFTPKHWMPLPEPPEVK